MADATGLSSVHVNRTIQQLRRDALIEWRGAAFLILDWDGLTQAAGFDPTYLQPGRGELMPAIRGGHEAAVRIGKDHADARSCARELPPRRPSFNRAKHPDVKGRHPDGDP